jgi:hypothetical protein
MFHPIVFRSNAIFFICLLFYHSTPVARNGKKPRGKAPGQAKCFLLPNPAQPVI